MSGSELFLLFLCLLIIAGLLLALLVIYARRYATGSSDSSKLIVLGAVPVTAAMPASAGKALAVAPIPFLPNDPFNMTFTPPNVPLEYTILSERLSAGVVRRSVDLETNTFTIVPFLVGQGQHFGFSFRVPVALAGTGIPLEGEPMYWNTVCFARNELNVPNAGAITNLVMHPAASGFVKFDITFGMQQVLTSGQVVTANFRIVYFYD